MTHVLRKSVGPWSAGTRVEVRSDNRDGTVTVEIMHVKPSKETGIDFEDLVFDIEEEYVVQLRDRSGDSPTNTRRERRAAKRQTNELLDNLMEKNK